MLPKNLYFIAITLPPEVAAEITAFKEDFARRFDCKAALRVVPHITLKAPFHLDPDAHTELLHWFAGLQLPEQPFEVQLTNFNVFNKPHPVVFVEPVQNEQLSRLQMAVTESFQQAFPHLSPDKNEIAFHPHITIAYRDLTPENFKKAWEEYRHKPYSARFGVDSIHLLQHNGARWEELGRVERS